MHEGIYSFGPFALDAAQRVLLRGEAPLRLTPREVDVLIMLVERHGELVDKGRIFERVWQGLCVEECNLSQHVASLRRALGDNAREPVYIETVPRRGYRFVAPVTRASGAAPAIALPPPASLAPPEPPAAAEPAATMSAAPPRARRPSAWSVAAALAVPLALALGFGMLRRGARAAGPAERTVAVLPFANLTGDAHQDDVARTLTAALMTDLRGVGGLRVEAASPPAGGADHAAGGDLLVETALLSGEGRLRLAAELIDVRTKRLLWAEMFEAGPVSFLEAERRIAQAIAAKIDGGPASDASGRPTDQAAARREYALARDYLSRRTPQVVHEALEHFRKAAELDPEYARAHAGVAEAYLLGVEQRVLDPAAALEGASRAAQRALALDASLAEAHAVMGDIAAARWDFDAAEAAYRRALSLDGAIARVHEHYAALLTVQDRHDQAIAEARVARDLDPLCPATATALAAAYFQAGRSEDAIEQALIALRLTPRFAAAYDVLGWAHQATGHDAEAIAAFAEAVRLSDRNPTYVAALARAEARAGARGEARRHLAELEGRAQGRAASPFDLAEVLAALGETDRALHQVERAVAEGAPLLRRVDAGVAFDALHDRARFRALVGRMRRAAAERVATATLDPAG